MCLLKGILNSSLGLISYRTSEKTVFSFFVWTTQPVLACSMSIVETSKQSAKHCICIFPHIDRIISVFSRILPESYLRFLYPNMENTYTVLSTYGKIRTGESPYFSMFHAVKLDQGTAWAGKGQSYISYYLFNSVK